MPKFRSMSARILALLAMTLCLATSARQSENFPDLEIPYEKYVLENGLTLIVHEDHKAPIVAVNVWYHVGSKDEKPGKTGFAHLFEHLMFQGSEHHDDEHFRPLEQVGATDMNGTTNSDRTNYFQNVPTPALDLALWLESDRMGHLLGVIDQARLDEQRGVVKNEKRQRENVPYGKVWELIAANTYPAGHPYSWTVIGSMEDLDAATLEDAHDWFKRYYGAANAVIAVAGDVKAEEVRKKVEHYFGDIPPGPPVPRQKNWIAKMEGAHRQTMQDRVPQARVYKVWNAPPGRTRAAVELYLAARLLTGTKNSRLTNRLVYRDQIATDVVAMLHDQELGSQMLIWATAKPGVELSKVEAVLDEELAGFLRDGPGDEDLERVRTRLYADILRGSERIGGFGGKSDILASSEVFGGSPDAYKEELRYVREARPESVRETAEAWLSDGVYILEVHPYPDYATRPSSADRSKLPDTGTPPELRLPAFQRFSLSNGLKVVLAERHAAPLVDFSLIFDAGFATDQSGGGTPNPGLATLAADMFDEGTRKRDALTISAELESLGASVGTGNSLDSTYINLSALRSLLDPAMEIYADVIRNPAFPEHEMERLKKNRIAGIKQEKSQPANLARRVLPQLLFGKDHAYGTPSTGSGTEASVAALSVEDMKRFHRNWIRPDNATLVVVGDITEPELKPMLEEHFGNWRATKAALPRKNLAPATHPNKARVFLINRPDAEQSVILAGHLAAPYDADNNLRLGLMNMVLGGQFTSRLNMNLREDKHWSYGANSSFQQAKGQQVFRAGAAVQSDKTAESMREILREIRELRDKRPPTRQELSAAQDNAALSLPGKHETNADISGAISKIVVYDLPDDYYDNVVSRLRELTTGDIRKTAVETLKPEVLTWVVVGDLAKIEAPVRKLALGEVQVLDDDGRVIR